MARIRKGDVVEVVAGNDRGSRGRVLRILRDRDRVVVEGVNLRWKHLRKSQQHPQGARLQRESAIHMSNVMPVDESAGRATRVGYDEVDGRKTRIARVSGKPLVASEPAAKSKGKSKKTAGQKKAGEESES